MIKAFDDEFYENDFDIFFDGNPENNTDYLIVNASKVSRYITPVAFFETRLENGTNYKQGVKFKNCENQVLAGVNYTN